MYFNLLHPLYNQPQLVPYNWEYFPQVELFPRRVALNTLNNLEKIWNVETCCMIKKIKTPVSSIQLHTNERCRPFVSSRPVPSRPVPSRPVPSRPVPSRPVPSRPVPSRPVPSRPVPSRPVPSRRRLCLCTITLKYVEIEV